MVHKKFIKRNGKVFGPYYYKTYRLDGKIKTKYLGTKPLKKDFTFGNFFYLSLFLILGLLIVGLFMFFSTELTGRASFELASSYQIGEEVKGNLNLVLKYGELLPLNSLIEISLGYVKQTVSLSELISDEVVVGDFYLESLGVSGVGEGYGVLGENVIYPNIDFSFLIKDLDEEEEEEGEEEVEDGEEESEDKDKKEKKEKDKDEDEEELGGSNDYSITGEVSKLNKIDGVVSYKNDYVYNLEQEKTAQLISGSVKVEGKKIDFGLIGFDVKDNQLKVSTEYSESVEGFGEEYLTDDVKTITINLENFNLTAVEGELKVSLIYGGEELISVSEKLNIEGVSEEEIVNETLSNETIINETLSNQTLSNESLIGDLSIVTQQYGAIINKPVKWKKLVNKSVDENVIIELPAQTLNISVKKIEELNEEVEEQNIKISGLTGQVIYGKVVDGNLVMNVEVGKQGFFTRLYKSILNIFNSFMSLTGRVVDGLDEEFVEVVIEDNSTEYEIEYYTEAPVSVEENISNGKKIVVSAPDVLNYENVLAYTKVMEKISIEDIESLKLYWVTNENVDFVGEDFLVDVEEKSVEVIEENLNKSSDVENISLKNKQEMSNRLRHSSLESNNYNGSKYLNFSVNNEVVGDALVVKSATTLVLKTSDPRVIRVRNSVLSESLGQGVLTFLTSQVISEELENDKELNNIVNQAGSLIDLEQEHIENMSEIVKQNFLTRVSETKVKVEFDVLDEDGDGYVDYVLWNVPYLSEQEYELIIEITKAEHLDFNRSFISDIYDEVSVKDNVWSEVINNSEYVRVSFERNLTRENDITIYARGLENVSSDIEVYVKNENNLIAKFENVSLENWYKIYLSGLNETENYETFDLKIVCEDNQTECGVEFDYIVDPDTVQPNTTLVSPSDSDGSLVNRDNLYVNVTSNDSVNNISTFIDFDNSLVGWWRMDDTLVNGTVYDNSTHCYDNETEIFVREVVECELAEAGASDIGDVVNDKKSRKGSNRMVKPNPLIQINNCKGQKYLNISVNRIEKDAGMAEWLLQSFDTGCLSGHEGSIPSASVPDNFEQGKVKLNKCYEEKWKLFSELNKTEEVATLNQETGEMEWELPMEWQEYNYDDEMFKIELEDGSELLVSEEHKVYAGVEEKENMLELARGKLNSKDLVVPQVLIQNKSEFSRSGQDMFNKNNKKYLNISSEKDNLISFFVVSEEYEDDGFAGFVNFESKNETFYYVNSFFTSEFIPERFVVRRVGDDFIDFAFKKFFQDRVLFAGFVNLSLASFFDNMSVSHFSSKISEAELNLINLPFCNLLFTSFTCSGLGESSSTGCQSIRSQNSQSSFVTSPICLNLSNISCLTNLIIVLISDLEFKLIDSTSSLVASGSFINSGMMKNNNEDYKKLLVGNFALQPIKEVYEKFGDGKEILFMNSENEPVKVVGISKEEYKGKIYDVDVGNDVVLVRRSPRDDPAGPKNSTGLWSGNSNHGTLIGHVTNTTVAGKMGDAIEFDGVGTYVEVFNKVLLMVEIFFIF